MRLVVGFILCLFYVQSSIAQVADSSLPHFSYETLSFQTEPFSTDSTRVDVYVAVPYGLLKFLYAVDKYVADYTVQITITPSSGDSGLYSGIDSKTILLSTAEKEKISELKLERANASQHTFILHQGMNYNILITVRDLSTKRQFTERGTFTTKTFSPDAAGMSDALIYRSKFNSRIVPHIGSDISSLQVGQSGVFFELYNAEQSRPLWLVQRLREHTGDEDVFRVTSVLVGSGAKRMPIFAEMDFDDIWTGKYILEQYLFARAEDTMNYSSQALHSAALSSSEMEIDVKIPRGIPISGMKIDDAIEQLLYIATGSAYDSLVSAQTTQDKRNVIVDFWNRMKPYQTDSYNRPMQVFYRRVGVADRNFRATMSGWKTDRGRIYIQLGEPTSIDKRPYDVNSRPYEMWEYSDLNVRFYFVDQFMVNDYRLVSAAPPNGIFNWQRE
ncbi:MAG TPA: GWxTD domain-containing protein [Candidatus Kapabacteria bacterium]